MKIFLFLLSGIVREIKLRNVKRVRVFSQELYQESVKFSLKFKENERFSRKRKGNIFLRNVKTMRVFLIV